MKTAARPAGGNPLPWIGYLNPLLDDPPSWPIAYMNGIIAYGWIKGNTTPQPLPIWLPGHRSRLSVRSVDPAVEYGTRRATSDSDR